MIKKTFFRCGSNRISLCAAIFLCSFMTLLTLFKEAGSREREISKPEKGNVSIIHSIRD